MKKSFSEWVSSFSVGNKFYFIIIVIVIALLIEAGSFYISVRLMAGIRAFIVGQDFWSIAQKDIYRYTVAYSISHDEADYNKMSGPKSVYIGDHNGRVELLKENPDYTYAKDQFVAAENNPEDIDDVIYFYKKARNTEYSKKAVYFWTQSDINIQKMIDIADKMRQIINTSSGPEVNEKIASLLLEANYLENQTTEYDKAFTNTISEASRFIKKIVIIFNIVLTIALGIFVIVLAKIIQMTSVQVDAAKTEFVSWASHQLRTPITSVKWRSDMLLKGKEGELTEKQKSSVNEIYNSNERMVKLVDNLLNAAHIEMGKFKVVIKQVDLRALLQEVVKEQQSEIEKRKQSVQIIGVENIQPINTDPVLVNNIFQNLLSNAIKYTPDNGQIVCTVKNQNDNILFEFKDNGIGIPESEQKRIFEKTFRASNALEKSPEGNGLGMYIIKGMIKALGGKIWFVSEQNKGTKFFVELPKNILK